MHLPCRLAGLSLRQVTNLGVRSGIPLGLSCSGSGRSVSESGTHLSALSCAQVRSSVTEPRDHTLSATQTLGTLHPACGTSPSLECDPGHTSSPPPCGSNYGSIRAYGLSDAKHCVSSPVDPVRSTTDSDHLKTKPHLTITPPTDQHGVSPYKTR